jgi:hypothetical protein
MTGEDVFLKVASEAPDELKERAALGLERAHGFVMEYGDALARCRGDCLVEASPAEIGAEAIANKQGLDGSFDVLVPHRQGYVVEALRRWEAGDAVLGTLDALGMLSDLGQLTGPCAERAVGFLESVQAADGSFGGAIEPEDRLSGTAQLGGLMARTRYVRPEALDGISRFLALYWEPSRVEGGQYFSLSGHASFFTNVKHEESDAALQWCGRELERGFRQRRLEACTLLGILLRCDTATLPGATLTPEELLTALLVEQARDGGFGALEPGGPPARVEPTLDAITASVRLCRSF